jgi:hypothetical protein
VLTRDEPDDHPWHHGLWFTIKFVNGENFWEEYDEYGVLRHDGPPGVAADDGVAIEGDVRWIRPDRQTVVVDERRRLTHVPLDGDAYAIDFATELVPHTLHHVGRLRRADPARQRGLDRHSPVARRRVDARPDPRCPE